MLQLLRSSSRPFRCSPLPAPSSSYCRTNIASRRVANKPGFGGRDLHRRRCEREGEGRRGSERNCALARRKLHAMRARARSFVRAFTTTARVYTCVYTHAYTRICLENTARKSAAPSLFVFRFIRADAAAAVMMIGAM